MTDHEIAGRSPGVRVIEVCCGSGALAYGLRQAGIEVTEAFDMDPNACASYEANLGRRPRQLDVRDVLRMLRAGWSAGPVDLLVLDPPGPPWSRAGKGGGLDDPRDTLSESVELIRRLRPTAFLLGNLSGLQDASARRVVQSSLGSLRSEGYCVRDFAVLDAVSYGVPQFRERPWWYGHLAGPCIVWPTPTHGDPKHCRQFTLDGVEPLQPWVTCADALGDLPVEALGRLVRGHAQTKGAMKWPWARPSTAVTCDNRLAPPGHVDRAIVLSEKATATLQGLPETWVLVGKTKAARWSQLVQAPTPAVATAIGRSLLVCFAAMANVAAGSIEPPARPTRPRRMRQEGLFPLPHPPALAPAAQRGVA